MLQSLLDVASGLSLAVCVSGWEQAQHSEEGAGGLEWEMFPSEGKPDFKTLLKISALESCGACWTGVLFQPWKMTGIHCANCVQMWGWVSHITHILRCLHVGFHLQTISNFQIALSFFFSCRSGGNCGQIPMLPGWWKGTLLGKEVFFLPCCVPTEGTEEQGREDSKEHSIPSHVGAHHPFAMNVLPCCPRAGFPHVPIGLGRGQAGLWPRCAPT